MNIHRLLLVALLFVSSAFCQNPNANDRSVLIDQLNHFDSSKDSVAIGVLVNAKGFIALNDTLVLSSLFDLTTKSDGYVTEYIGLILSDLILRNTDFYLNTLSKQPSKHQLGIAEVTFYKEGGGMSDSEYNIVRDRLLKYQTNKNGRLSSTSKRCLTALQNVIKELKSK